MLPKMLRNFAVTPNSVAVLPLPPPPIEVGGTHQADKQPLSLQVTVSQRCNLSPQSGQALQPQGAKPMA